MKYLLTLAMLFFILFPTGASAQEPVPVVKGITPVLTTNGKQPIANNTYAVVVGISDYQDEGIPDLRFADKDALAFAGFLQSPAGGSLDEDHLKVLINEKATAAQFAIALDWLWEVVKENDKVIIYFSGHGDVEKKSLTQPGYLLCWDAPSHVYMAGGAFNVRDLKDVVSTLSIQNKAKVILITDACRSGKLSGSGIGGAQATTASLAAQYANEIKILSCQPDEYSIEGEQWGGGRGAFSYHLLDGLYGLADEDENLNVNLKEIGRYLEDKVTEEVAPQSQNPMVLGSKTENLTMVFPELLAQLKEGRKGQLQMFTATESRGIEEEVLADLSASGAEADSNIVGMYLAFKRSLKNRQFLEPANACADFYYEQLGKEPQLEKLHSSMRRNYAAALQDDAQQVMNIMLKSGLTETVLKNAKYADLYYNYPTYLKRASELLGEAHYMYTTLQARKHFFEGMVLNERKDKRQAFRKALSWQPDMVHAMVYLTRNFEAEQVDSAEVYTQKAGALVPTWVEPYIALADFYRLRLKQPDKEEEMLNLAGEVDSTSVFVWYKKANCYYLQKKYTPAEKWFLKTIEGSGEDICFPCAHHQLGNLYKKQLKRTEAARHYRKAIEIDSTFSLAFNGLASTFAALRQYPEAELYYKKSLELNPENKNVYYNLGVLYYETHQYDKAEEYCKLALRIDSAYLSPLSVLGSIYNVTNRREEVEKTYKRVLEIDPIHGPTLINLGILYQNAGQLKEAEKVYHQAFEYKDPFVNLFAHNRLGDLYLEEGRFIEAEIELKKAIQLDSTSWRAHANLGVLYQSLQRWKESEEMVIKAIQYGPPKGALVGMLGNTYTHMPGRLKEAKAKLDKGLAMSPNSPDVHIYLAQWYLINNQQDHAWKYFENGLEKGIGSEGLRFFDLQDEPNFTEMQKDPKWNELMKKYFPEQYKN